MVIGYDVCHDTRSKEKSFGAFVATLDRHMTEYYSIVNAHTSGEELSSHMSFNIGSALRKYREKNGNIFFQFNFMQLSNADYSEVDVPRIVIIKTTFFIFRILC